MSLYCKLKVVELVSTNIETFGIFNGKLTNSKKLLSERISKTSIDDLD